MSHFDISIGPALPGYGSWGWRGEHLLESLSKHRAQLSRDVRVVYCPVDFFGSVEHIDSASEWLTRCDLVVSHSERLVRDLNGYPPTLFCEHPLKYALAPREDRPSGSKGTSPYVAPRGKGPARENAERAMRFAHSMHHAGVAALRLAPSGLCSFGEPWASAHGDSNQLPSSIRATRSICSRSNTRVFFSRTSGANGAHLHGLTPMARHSRPVKFVISRQPGAPQLSAK